MRNLWYLTILIGIVLSACEDTAKELYDKTDPNPIEVEKLIPAKLQLTFKQTIIPDNTLQSNESSIELEISNLTGKELSDVNLLINIYKDTNFVPSNRVLNKKLKLESLKITEKSEPILISTSISDILEESQIDIQLLSASGIKGNAFGNTYRGEYFLTGISQKDTTTVGFGTVMGYINCDGNFRLNALAGDPLKIIHGFVNENGQISAQANFEGITDQQDLDNIPKNQFLQRADSLELIFTPQTLISELDSAIKLSLLILPN